MLFYLNFLTKHANTSTKAIAKTHPDKLKRHRQKIKHTREQLLVAQLKQESREEMEAKILAVRSMQFKRRDK